MLHLRLVASVQATDKTLLPLVDPLVFAVGEYLDDEHPKRAPNIIQITSRFVESPSHRPALRSKLEELIEHTSATLASFLDETSVLTKFERSNVNIDAICDMVEENDSMAINGNGKGTMYAS